MNQIKALGRDLVSARKLFHLSVKSISEISFPLGLPSRHFVLFLAWDARTTNSQLVHDLALRFVDEGVAWLCAWGPDCERVHDIFDKSFALRQDENPQPSCLMTTSHDENLKEGIWFFLNCTVPDESLADDCSVGLAISVANETWDREITAALSDSEHFSQRLLKDES